jgi:uncharacterized protein (TIGR03435 family)
MASAVVLCQDPPNESTFEVAAVRPSAQMLGPDANNRLALAPAGITARNATLRRLVAEAYRLQLAQVLGPEWLDRNEYDIDAKAAGPVAREQIALLLRALLAERFRLTAHPETRNLRIYELTTDRAGPKIQPVKDSEAPAEGGGMQFRGDLRQFCDLLALQLSIPVVGDPSRPGRAAGAPVPVLDKTGLAGTYSFGVDVRSEPGADMFSLWQRALRDRMGLRLESRRGMVRVVVIDSAEKVPAAN